ncbi:hypothetical protein, partial [Endozoicomonas numazuensis]|uniref:hypothetical protein n=1 Tax=Endozoicomonas numazuensis TaxID=1137799 RepID=UPI000554B15A
MLWLKRLTASKMKPVGIPDFNKAPWRTINLSGTELRFKNPSQTTGIFAEHFPDRFDLYDDNYELWPDGLGMTQDIFKSGWSFFDHLIWGEGSVGGLDVYIQVQRRHPHNRSIDSLFKDEDARQWIQRINDNSFNDSDSDQNWIYPRAAHELPISEINGTAFYSYKATDWPHTWKSYFETPITDDHLLIFRFNPSSWHKHLINDLDTVSEAAEKTVQSFMENVHIKLSDDALRCQAVYQSQPC